jgi:hypothetical protein
MTTGCATMDEETALDFKRECERIAREEEMKAKGVRERAGRLALNSNGRRKLITKAEQLEEHAELMMAAADAHARDGVLAQRHADEHPRTGEAAFGPDG